MSEMKETEAKRPIMPDAGADNRPLVELTHVEKHYGDLHVLKDINLTVRKGEVLVIVGPSGSGKSTIPAISASTANRCRRKARNSPNCVRKWAWCSNRSTCSPTKPFWKT